MADRGRFPEDSRPGEVPDLIARLESIRPQVIRGIETFFEWDASLVRNTDYLGLRNEARFDFLEGDIVNSNGRRIDRSGSRTTCSTSRSPTRTQRGYRFSDTEEDYLVGALARVNLNETSSIPGRRELGGTSLALP